MPPIAARIAPCILPLLLATWTAHAADVKPPTLVFEITLDASVADDPLDGRVILFFTQKEKGEPRTTHGWLSTAPIFGADVRNWKPGTTVTIRDPIGYPHDAADVPPATYRVQAVLHTNPDLPHGGNAPGNLISRPVQVETTENGSPTIRLTLDDRVPADKKNPNAERNTEVKLRSALLSDFHGRDIFHRARVILPKAHDKSPGRRFPTVYIVHGFGGSHHHVRMYLSLAAKSDVPFALVGLDANMPTGHHVFADSDNNGPCGQALIEELIPHLESTFPLIAKPHARFLTGHSSGGWSTLWLQLTYPDVFGGVWSTSPDSVTFRDFCGIDLYADGCNFYRDPDGNPRPLMRQGDAIRLNFEDLARMERALGPGGQFYSFEAVFGPRATDGRPRPLYDRQTGAVDPVTIQAWRRYDMCDIVKKNWPRLGPRLAGKITIIMGEKDNFYLEGATRILGRTLERLGSDARVILEPGKNHGNIFFAASFQQMFVEMGERFGAHEPAADARGRSTSQPVTTPAAD